MDYTQLPRVEQTEIYRDWINALKDRIGRAKIQVRVDRLVHGNPGDHRHLSGGVSELRIDVGPGYRVYYTRRGSRLLLLLVGGDKSTQQNDIERAIELARGFEE
jgi:putative addiction module killer protein